MDWFSIILGAISLILGILGIFFPNLKSLFDLFSF